LFVELIERVAIGDVADTHFDRAAASAAWLNLQPGRPEFMVNIFYRPFNGASAGSPSNVA